MSGPEHRKARQRRSGSAPTSSSHHAASSAASSTPSTAVSAGAAATSTPSATAGGLTTASLGRRPAVEVDDNTFDIGAWSGRMAAPFAASDAPARLYDEHNVVLQLIYAADPLHSLSGYYEKLIESGVGSFTDLEPIDEHDLLALGMGCDDARAFVLAKRNFDHVLSTPRASDVNIGLDWNERFRNLLWLGFSTPVALSEDWRNSYYVTSGEQIELRRTFGSWALRPQKTAPVPQHTVGVLPLAEYFILGAWMVVRITERTRDGGAVIQFFDGTTRRVPPSDVKLRMRGGVSADHNLGVSEAEAREKRQHWAKMALQGVQWRKRNHGTPCSPAAAGTSGAGSNRRRCLHPGCRCFVRSRDQLLCRWHRAFYMCSDYVFLRSLDMCQLRFTVDGTEPHVDVPGYELTDHWIFVLDMTRWVALPRATFGGAVSVAPTRAPRPLLRTATSPPSSTSADAPGRAKPAHRGGAATPPNNNVAAASGSDNGGSSAGGSASGGSNRPPPRAATARGTGRSAPEPDADSGWVRRNQPFFFWNSDYDNFWLSNWYRCKFTATHTRVYERTPGDASDLVCQTWGDQGLCGFLCLMGRGRRDVEDAVRYEFTSAEQFIMAAKASHFRDWTSFRAIMAASSARECKALGRKVAGYVDNEWIRLRPLVLREAVTAKFAQNNRLKKRLLGTVTRPLVEASPHDIVYGIGLDPDQARRADPLQWPGANLLGDILMDVRGLMVGAQRKELMGPAIFGRPQIAVVADIGDTTAMREQLRSLELLPCPEETPDFDELVSLADDHEEANALMHEHNWECAIARHRSTGAHASLPLKRHRPRFAVWYMSPPCQPFCQKLEPGQRNTRRNRQRSSLLEKSVDLITTERPLFCFLENVTGMLQSKEWRRCEAKLHHFGYRVTPIVLFAQQLGVAVRRRRVIVVITPVFIPDFASAIVDRMHELGFDPIHQLGVRDIIPGVRHFYSHRRLPKWRGVHPGHDIPGGMLTSCLNEPISDYSENAHADDSAPIDVSRVLDADDNKMLMAFPTSWVLPDVDHRCDCGTCNRNISAAGTALGNAVTPPMTRFVTELMMGVLRPFNIQVAGVEFFCGHGGAHHGASSAGVEVVRAFDICPTAVSFFNTNADKVQHDPHLERRQRALVRGVANLTHDDSGRLASVTMHVSRGRLGAHFMGGPITDHGRWCVMGLHEVMGREGPLEEAGVVVGMYLVNVDGVPATSLAFPDALSRRDDITRLKFIRGRPPTPPRPRRLTARMTMGPPRARQLLDLHGSSSTAGSGASAATPRKSSASRSARPRSDDGVAGVGAARMRTLASGGSTTGEPEDPAKWVCPVCGIIISVKLATCPICNHAQPAAPAACRTVIATGPSARNDATGAWHGFGTSPTCIFQGCNRPPYGGHPYCGRSHARAQRTKLLLAGAPVCADPHCSEPRFHFSQHKVAQFCSPACAAAGPPIGAHGWHGFQLRPRCLKDGCQRKCFVGMDFCCKAHAVARGEELLAARQPLCRRPACMKARFQSGVNLHDFCSRRCEKMTLGTAAEPATAGAGHAAHTEPRTLPRAARALPARLAPATARKRVASAANEPFPPRSLFGVDSNAPAAPAAAGDADDDDVMSEVDDADIQEAGAAGAAASGDSDGNEEAVPVLPPAEDIPAEPPPPEPPPKPGGRSRAFKDAPAEPLPLELPPEPGGLRRSRAQTANFSRRAASAAASAALAAKHARRASFLAERDAHSWSRTLPFSDCVGTALPTSVMRRRLRSLRRRRAQVSTSSSPSRISQLLLDADKLRNAVNEAGPHGAPADSRDPDCGYSNTHVSALKRTERRRLAAQLVTSLRDDGMCRPLFTPLWHSRPDDAFPSDTDPRSMYESAPPRNPRSSTATHHCKVSQRHENWAIAHMSHCSQCQEHSTAVCGVPPPLKWMRCAHTGCKPPASAKWELKPSCYQQRLLEDLRCGFDPMPARPIRPCVRRNGPSCFDEFKEMDAYMNKLDPLGCLTEGCWSLPDNAVMSAMHCVTRASDIRKAEREPGFECPVRTVTDFTATEVNDAYDDWRFRMGGVEAGIKQLTTSPDLRLACVDISKAFPSLPLGSEARKHCWIKDPRASSSWHGNGKPTAHWLQHDAARRAVGRRFPPYRQWTGLPLGFKLAPAFACAVTSEAAQYLFSMGITVAVYVDDVLIVSDSANCQQDLDTVISVLGWLGFKVSKEKTVPPSKAVLFLGLYFDPHNRMVTVDEDRRVALLDDARRLLRTPRILFKELESVIGKLSFVSQVCRGGRAYTQRLRSLLVRAERSGSRHLLLDLGARLDLKWWVTTLSAPVVGSSICMTDDLPTVLPMKSDASGALGFGYVFGDVVHFSRFEDHTAADDHIGYKETLALVHVAEEYGHLLTGKILRCGVDNSGVAFTILRGATSCLRTQSLLRRLADAQVKHNFDIVTAHVSRDYNTESDMLSRFSRMQEVNDVLPSGVVVADESAWGRCLTSSPASDAAVYFAPLKRLDNNTSRSPRAAGMSARRSTSSTTAPTWASPPTSATRRSRPSSSGTSPATTTIGPAPTLRSSASCPRGAATPRNGCCSSLLPTRASSAAYGNTCAALKCVSLTSSRATCRSRSRSWRSSPTTSASIRTTTTSRARST